MKQDQLFSEHFDFALIVKKSLKLYLRVYCLHQNNMRSLYAIHGCTLYNLPCTLYITCDKVNVEYSD